jgi:hypothetical protein
MSGELQACPHCGAAVRYAGDAFCSECRGRLDEPPVGTTETSTSDGRPVPPLDLGALLPINVAGLVMIAASFLPALGVCRLIGDDRDGLKLVIGGPLALALDLVYRIRSPDGNLFLPGRGGKLAYLPLWVFGIFWLCYGVWQLA